MIAQGIELPMAGASARGHAQAPQQEHAELGAGDRDVRVGGRDMKGPACESSNARDAGESSGASRTRAHRRLGLRVAASL